MAGSIKAGESIELCIESLGFEGISIARHEGMVVFVEGGLPQERVIARIRRTKKKHAEAVIEQILDASPLRVEPRCRYFGDCGGCKWQQCDYQGQVAWKQQSVVDCFERLGQVPYGEIKAIIASPQQYHYRNKMEFSFSARRWLTNAEIAGGEEFTQRDFALGLHVPGRFDAVIDVEECHIQHTVGNEVLATVRREAIARGVSAYHQRQHTGFLRNLVIRKTKVHDELMLILVTSAPQQAQDEEFLGWFASDFLQGLPADTTVIHAVNDTQSPVAAGTPRILQGQGYIREESHGIVFRISPFSFFQTNSYQLHNFLEATFNAAQLHSSQTVWDLYCGTGSISLPAAKQAGEVIGLELVQSSIDDAKANAAHNAITNAQFHCADLHKQQTIDFLTTLPKPDVIIVDPPRAGIHEQTLRHLLSVEAPRIVYVSCNPATQARDCAILAEKYEVEYLQPIDMFPHTFHVENVARLNLRSS